MSLSLLLKHCDNNKQQLQEINDKLTAVGMKAKLKKYKSKLVQEPVIIAAYLNPQIPKSIDSTELKLVVDLVCNLLQHHYSVEVSSPQSIEQEAAGNSLFAAMFQLQRGVSGNNDEVDQYLSISASSSHRGASTSCRGGWPKRNHCRATTRGHGLPWNAGNVDAIKTGQQCRCSRIHMHLAVVVIVGVRHDNVPAFVDECRYPQSADKSSASNDCPRTGRHQQCGVDRPGA